MQMHTNTRILINGFIKTSENSIDQIEMERQPKQKRNVDINLN